MQLALLHAVALAPLQVPLILMKIQILDSTLLILLVASKRSASSTTYNTSERESKKAKVTVAEGVNRVAEEMRESRILRQELAIRTTTAIQLLSSKYQGLNSDQFVKATYHLADPKNAEIFLALKDIKESQERWLKTCLGIYEE